MSLHGERMLTDTSDSVIFGLGGTSVLSVGFQGLHRAGTNRIQDARDIRFEIHESMHAYNANLFAGMLTTCTDLATLGVAVLEGGRSADGDQVIPADYLAAALEPSTDLNAAYGLLWWLNRPGEIVAADVAAGGQPARLDGPLVPEAAADTVWAIGFQQQILAVLPSMDAVAVRLGARPPEGVTFDVPSFTTDVLDVLDEAAR
jgi:CubicO group peptidase (beta-lactamase class C family)